MSESQDMETDQENAWEDVWEEEKESSVSNYGFDGPCDYNTQKKVRLPPHIDNYTIFIRKLL